MATYDLKYPGAAIDAILDTAYHLQQAGYIFRGSASDYSGTPTEREWVIAPAGFSGLGLSSAVPQGSIGICLYNGTSWVGKIINVATIDSTPTQNSGNAVSSGGAYAAINQLSASVTEALENLTFTDTTPSAFQDEYINMKVSTTEGGVERILTYLTILAATTSKAGLLSAADKMKIDSFLTNLRSLTFADTTASADQGTKITETLKATIGGVQEVIDSITLLAATSSKAGLLSASDKAYIDALPATLTNLSNSISGALALMQSLVGYYTCDTAAGTAAKTVAAAGYSLTNGGCIRIKMTNANTADNATLNINSTGAKALYYDGAQASSTNTWEAGEVLEVYYDGTQYQCASAGGGKFDVEDSYEYDFAVADEYGYMIVEFADGHIKTKEFDSRNVNIATEDDNYSDFSISDENGFDIVEFRDGHIMTKNFDSSALRIRDYSSKVVNCLGDSITFGNISSGNRANPTWVKGVSDNIGCVCNNYGVSATSICDGSSESFVTRLNNMTQNDIDVLLIFGGTNDYGDRRAQTLGSITDTPVQGTNFYASFKYLIETAINKYPNAIIAVITPLRRSTYAANSYGISMEDIVNAEIDVANYYGLPLLDMYHHGSINPTISIMRTNYTADGLHPNQAGINRFLIPIFSEFTYNIIKYL